jgi:hypothetical protein
MSHCSKVPSFADDQRRVRKALNDPTLTLEEKIGIIRECSNNAIERTKTIEEATETIKNKNSTMNGELPGGKRRKPRKIKRAKKQSKKTAARRR